MRVFTFYQVLFEFPELQIKNMQQWTGRSGGLPGPRWSQDLQQAVCVFWRLVLVTSVAGSFVYLYNGLISSLLDGCNRPMGVAE